MTITANTLDPQLDLAAAERWPVQAATHVLGIGLVLAVLVALLCA